MEKLRGVIDLYKYRQVDGAWKLVDKHHQENYDTIRGRITPTFSANCYRISRLECALAYEYARPPLYDELSKYRIYFNEPLFVPGVVDIGRTGSNWYALSYDGGATWWTYDGTALSQVSFSTAAGLRSVGMTDALFESMDADIHTTKYDDSIIIASTPADSNSTVSKYSFRLMYDSDRIDPYYARWVGDIPTLPRYALETLPISSGKTGDTYSINISNIAGVAPISLDTLLTYTGPHIGTFTYVGLTVDVDEILVGSYTITLADTRDVSAIRNANARSIFWGNRNITSTDGVLGGVRHHGGESNGGIYTYNGGASQNVWMWPFMPDRKFRAASYSRSVWMPYDAAHMAGSNIVDPNYGLISSGGVVLESSDKVDHYSGLSFWAHYLRFCFTLDGNSGVSKYILGSVTNTRDLLAIDRIRPLQTIYTDANNPLWVDTYGNYAYVYISCPMLRRPDKLVPWSALMYMGLLADGVRAPRCAYNTYHDVIVEVYDARIDIFRYGGPIMLSINAANDELFECAYLTLEDPSGRDLTVRYKVISTGTHHLASLPVTLSRRSGRDIGLLVTGDLSERVFYSNITSPVALSEVAGAMKEMLLVQDAKGGTWGTSALLDALKSKDDDPFLCALHDDISGQVGDETKIFDQIWGLRHLKKSGTVSTSSDLTGDVVANFGGASLLYLDDTNGASGRLFKWASQKPTLSTYVEFQPSSAQESTVFGSRGLSYRLGAGGQITVPSPLASTVTATQQNFVYKTYTGSFATYLSYTDPLDDTRRVVGFPSAGFILAKSMDLSSMTGPLPYATGAVGFFREVYFDASLGSTQIVEILPLSTSLSIRTYDISSRAYTPTTTFAVGGAPFTHAYGALTSMYEDDAGDPILVIYSGSGWTLSDGILKINMRTKVLTQIITTGQFFPWTQTGYDDNRKAVTFKSPTGDWVTAAIRYTSTGETYFFNHSTGVCDKQNLGSLSATSGAWSVSALPGTRYALYLCAVTPYQGGSTRRVSVIDLHTRSLVLRDSASSGPGYGAGPGYQHENSTCIALYPAGSQIQVLPSPIRYCGMVGDYWSSGTYLLDGSIDAGALLAAENAGIPYTATSSNRLATVEFSSFALTLSDGNVITHAAAKAEAMYKLAHTEPRLSSVVCGGELSYTSGDSGNIASYTSSRLYSGTVKNITLKTQPLAFGAYKFAPRLHRIDDIVEFRTRFAGLTSFLIYIAGNGTYFIDANNAGTLTRITSGNRATVTPNSIGTINARLADIGAVFPAGRIGLVYYDINGNLADAAYRSETYAVMRASGATAPAPPYRYSLPSRNSEPVMVARNGNLYMVDTPFAAVTDQTGTAIWYSPQTGNWSALQPFFSVSAGVDNTTSLITAVSYGGDAACMASFSLGKDDSVLTYTLYNGTWAPNDPYSPRHLICHDVFSGEQALSLWLRQSVGPIENTSIEYFCPWDMGRRSTFIPMVSLTLADGLTDKVSFLPLSWKDGVFNTSHPFPADATKKFESYTNISAGPQWGNTRWYFVDGGGVSFKTNELLSFALHNHYGYAIDNYQVISTANMLSKGNLDDLTGMPGTAIDGSMVGVNQYAVVVDEASAGFQNGGDDAFFIIFSDKGRK